MRQHLVVCAAQAGLREERAEPFQGARVDITARDHIAVRHEVEDARRAKTAVQPDYADTICAHKGPPSGIGESM